MDDFIVKGNEPFIEAPGIMKSVKPFQLDIKNIITHSDSAAVDGVMKSPDGNRYAFCDVYKLNGFKNSKIKK